MALGPLFPTSELVNWQWEAEPGTHNEPGYRIIAVVRARITVVSPR